MGPPQDIPHVDILRPVTRRSRTLRVPEQVVRELDEAVATAFGDAGEPGPVYVEIPTDVLREPVPSALVLEEWLAPKPLRLAPPDPATVERAQRLLWQARRLDQEANYGGRVVGTTLRHLDCAGLARALGARGERVVRPQEMRPALERALADPPAVVDVVTLQRAVSSDARKGLGFVPDFQPLLD